SPTGRCRSRPPRPVIECQGAPTACRRAERSRMALMTRAALLGALLVPLAAAAGQDQRPPETKPVPSGSVEIATTGCLKGRVFTATEPPEESMRKGPTV